MSRLDLHKELERALGSKNVYFQPPTSVKMQYDAIVYRISNPHILHANNKLYAKKQGYTVTLITKSPDNEAYDKILSLPNCRFDRFYTADRLNHYVFTIYY